MGSSRDDFSGSETNGVEPADVGSGRSDAERRRHPRVDRHDGFTYEIVDNTESDSASSRTELLHGWVYDLSRSGICFVCMTDLTDRQIVVRLGLPKNGLTLIEANVVHCREVIDGLWECGASFGKLIEENDVQEASCTASEFLLPTDSLD